MPGTYAYGKQNDFENHQKLMFRCRLFWSCVDFRLNQFRERWVSAKISLSTFHQHYDICQLLFSHCHGHQRASTFDFVIMSDLFTVFVSLTMTQRQWQQGFRVYRWCDWQELCDRFGYYHAHHIAFCALASGRMVFLGGVWYFLVVVALL